MALGLIYFQNFFGFNIQRRIYFLKSLTYILMYGAFAYAKALGSAANRRLVFYYKPGKLHSTLLHIAFHINPLNTNLIIYMQTKSAVFREFPHMQIFLNIFSEKTLTNCTLYCIIIHVDLSQKYGGIAQLARAFGSYPKCRWFKSICRYQRPGGQAVKTPPFHGGNTSSILVRVTKSAGVVE